MNYPQDAKCRKEGKPTSFFYPSNTQESNLACKYCQNCPVKNECLEAGIENNEMFGIWGGVSERKLNRIRRERKGV